MDTIRAIDDLIESALGNTEAAIVHLPADRDTLSKQGKFLQLTSANKTRSKSKKSKSETSVHSPRKASVIRAIDDLIENAIGNAEAAIVHMPVNRETLSKQGKFLQLTSTNKTRSKSKKSNNESSVSSFSRKANKKRLFYM